jgi:sec-independent protein translocase protein TatA
MPGFIGMPELLLLGLVALIIFGPKRLPEMGRGLGKGLREFKESVTADHKEHHRVDESQLELPQELTAAPIAPEPVATIPVAAVPDREAERVA